MGWLELVPAYGRDYTNQKQVRDDWDNDKDFRIAATGQMINKSDAKREGALGRITVRYARERKVMSL